MQIIIVGAGKVGSSLTAQLLREHRVTVIDQEPKLIENIINVYDVILRQRSKLRGAEGGGGK